MTLSRREAIVAAAASLMAPTSKPQLKEFYRLERGVWVRCQLRQLVVGDSVKFRDGPECECFYGRVVEMPKSASEPRFNGEMSVQVLCYCKAEVPKELLKAEHASCC